MYVRKSAALIAIAVLTLVSLPSPSRAEQKMTKHELIMKLMKTLNAQEIARATIDQILQRLASAEMGSSDSQAQLNSMPEEQRAEMAKEQQRMQKQMADFRERLSHRVDFQKFAEDIYYPLFDKTFTEDELRQLDEFYSTKAGQKEAKILPELTLEPLFRGTVMLQQQMQSVMEEMQKEDSAKHPEKKTMADIRSVATAAEAYATDVNHYPDARTWDDLKPVLSPTYIRTLPDKDGWGGDYAWVVSDDKQHYRIVSGGSDLDVSPSSRIIPATTPAPHSTTNLSEDLIYQDGSFVQFPDTAATSEGTP
jgi:hypothetical protein